MNERLVSAVDRLVSAVRALAPEGADVGELDTALGDLLAEALNAASAQSAGSVLAVREELHQRLVKLEGDPPESLQ